MLKRNDFLKFRNFSQSKLAGPLYPNLLTYRFTLKLMLKLTRMKRIEVSRTKEIPEKFPRPPCNFLNLPRHLSFKVEEDCGSVLCFAGILNKPEMPKESLLSIAELLPV